MLIQSKNILLDQDLGLTKGNPKSHINREEVIPVLQVSLLHIKIQENIQGK